MLWGTLFSSRLQTGTAYLLRRNVRNFMGRKMRLFPFPVRGNRIWAGDVVVFSVRRQLPALGACMLSFHLAKTFSFGL